MEKSRRERASGRSAAVLLLTCFLAAVATGWADSRGIEVVGPGGKTVVEYRGSYALLVGVSDYTAGWPDLEGIPAKLKQLSRTLAELGFEVVEVLDPDSDELRSAYTSFIDRYGYQRDHRLLFFFAGHGHTWVEADQAYLLPADAPRPSAEPQPEFLRKALRMSQLLSWSRQITANHALFVFDSCFSGSIFKERSLATEPPHITAAIARPARVFITAGTAGETVPARSVFTPALVDALAHADGDLDGDGYVTGMELGLYLETTVPRHARQSPQFGKHPDYRLSRGDFVFVVDAAGRAIASPTRAPDERPAPVPVAGLGVHVYTISLAAAALLGKPMGAQVAEVDEGSPADVAGIRAGDMILQYGKLHTQTAEILREVIDATPPGITVDLLIQPGDGSATRRVDVVVGDGDSE